MLQNLPLFGDIGDFTLLLCENLVKLVKGDKTCKKCGAPQD
jgi:hypothetical protein